jgi:hypothetical protein
VVEATLPNPGRYQLIADFSPRGGIPQLIQRAIVTAGFQSPLRAPKLRDAPDRPNHFRLESEPLYIDRASTLTFSVDARKWSQYLGAWAHLVAVSEDLRDVIHTHPQRDGDRLRFDLHFGHAGKYRMWIQAELEGQLVTEAFTVSVAQKEVP